MVPAWKQPSAGAWLRCRWPLLADCLSGAFAFDPSTGPRLFLCPYGNLHKWVANVIARCYINPMKRREPMPSSSQTTGLEGPAGLLEALAGLGDFLKAAADTIEGVDEQLAGQLGG